MGRGWDILRSAEIRVKSFRVILYLKRLENLAALLKSVGFSYDNGRDTVLIATLTNSVGQLIGSNQVECTNTLVGFNADLLKEQTQLVGTLAPVALIPFYSVPPSSQIKICFIL